MIVRNKAAVVSSQANKNKKQVAYERSSEDGKFDPDHTDLKTNGVISNGINGNRGEHVSNGYSAESDSLTIAHARSKSAPAINQAGVKLRHRKGERGRNHDANNDEEDYEAEDDDMDDCDDSDADECYKKITEGAQNAQPEEPRRIRPHFTKNSNSDNKAYNKEKSKATLPVNASNGQGKNLPNHYNSVGNLEAGSPIGSDGRDIMRHEKSNHVYDVPEGEDYMAIYETIDRKRQEARELKNKSHSMEALETPNASIQGDDDQGSSFDFKISDTKRNASHLQKHSDSSASSSSRRRHRSKPHESNKAKSTSNSFQQQDYKRWSIHEKSISSSSASNSFQAQQPIKKLSNTSIGNNPNCTPNNPQPNGSSHHIVTRNIPSNIEHSTDFTDGSMASFLKRALRMEGPQLCQRTITIKKTVRESLGMRIGGGIGSNEGDTPIYIANIHPHGCIGKSKNLKVYMHLKDRNSLSNIVFILAYSLDINVE